MAKLDKVQKKILKKINRLAHKKNKAWDVLHLAKAYRAIEDTKKK